MCRSRLFSVQSRCTQAATGAQLFSVDAERTCCDDAAKVLSTAGIEADVSSTPVELQFIPVAVVDECAHEVWDVEAKVADQFSGIDLVNRQTRLHMVKSQIRQECGMYDLSVEGSPHPS